VYGDEKVIPFVEGTPFVGPALSPYGETKRETEHIAATYADKEVKSIGLRFFSIYGERCRPDLAPYIFTNALFHGKEITVLGDGTARRDFTYVSDAVAAVLSAVDTVHNVRAEVVNVGNNNPLPVTELIGTLEEFTGKTARIVYKEKHRGDAAINCADLTKAHSLLNYQPKVKLHEGLTRFVEWFKKEQR
jgi:UDP-glucuronate 4-epimerase